MLVVALIRADPSRFIHGSKLLQTSNVALFLGQYELLTLSPYGNMGEYISASFSKTIELLLLFIFFI